VTRIKLFSEFLLLFGQPHEIFFLQFLNPREFVSSSRVSGLLNDEKRQIENEKKKDGQKQEQYKKQTSTSIHSFILFTKNVQCAEQQQQH
jgi:hypothetical protein